ncbi:MAG: GGDEF domain-containing protein, partial [Anaerotignaceae bacterium]
NSFRKQRLLLILILIYVVLGTVITYYQYRYITNYQYVSLGESAFNLAAVAVETLEITNEDVEELESISFEELREHPLNNEFEKLFKLVEETNSIKYAYVLRHLSDDKVKYTVDENDADFYNLPAGTDLDYVWLLDVVVDTQLQKDVLETSEYYKDKNRYTKVDDLLIKILENREAQYTIAESEWGQDISGLVPIYTVEGEYIGLLGVDIYSESFYEYRSSIFWSLSILIMIPTILTSIIYVYMHLAYRKKMSALAYKDQLTKVYNRRYFDGEGGKIFHTALKNNTSMGIILGDIDDFKLFNDKYGHQEGDIALQLVTSVMESFLTEKDGFVARYGGEEFVMVLDNPADITELCRNICKAVSEKEIKNTNGDFIKVTISLGAYEKIPEDGDSLEMFVKKADDAMYQAKRTGKNRFIIGSE